MASLAEVRPDAIAGSETVLRGGLGGGEADVPLDGLDLPAPVEDERLIGIHEVLDRLEAEDELKAHIVKLRYFSGMNHGEIAGLLGLNEKTVRRHWNLAKLWLYQDMKKNL